MPDLFIEDLIGVDIVRPKTTRSRMNGLASDCRNVLLEVATMGRRRPSLATVSLTSGPSDTVHKLLRHQPAASTSAAELWAFSSTNTCHRLVSGTWNSVSLSDTVADISTSRPHGATFNGKLFLAYNSDVNRLHVWDGTAVRRVGIEASAAPTVADTGSGSYAATIRYYKAQFKIKSGSDVIATSELSAAVSFTPSGSGTAARVTKPTTPDSATHWRVFGSADNVTFYELGSADIAVGTTTYDDSTAPSAYSSGTVAPTPGLSVPPPSAKYLLSADNRLFMAGAWETTAAATQTATRNSRVWFTAVLGARDNTGEDESIAQTADLRHWIDCGENDGDAIVGLAGPLDGLIYVFKERYVWRLTPTGLVDAPYRADRIVEGTGLVWQDGVALGEDGSGSPALYFLAVNGPKRITPGRGMEDIGANICRPNTDSVFIDTSSALVWDQTRRMLWAFKTTGENLSLSYQPQFEIRSESGIQGGWMRHTFAGVSSLFRTAVLYEVSGVLRPFVGGATGLIVASLSGQSHQDLGKTFTPSITTHTFLPAFPSRVRVMYPIMEWLPAGSTAATSFTVVLRADIAGPALTVQSLSGTTTNADYSSSGSFNAVHERLEGLTLGDMTGFSFTITWDTSAAFSGGPIFLRMVVPWEAEAPL